MALPRIPADPAEQVRWLVDRAAISDLLVEYARCVDRRDWPSFAALYTPGGVLEVAGTRREGTEAIERAAELLVDYANTHHVTTNHAIHIDGDSARATAYCIASHVPDAVKPADHADAGVIYHCTLARVSDGWRFTCVRGERVWISGGRLPGEASASDGG
jgi:ketosteroid isomerase-like protein